MIPHPWVDRSGCAQSHREQDKTRVLCTTRKASDLPRLRSTLTRFLITMACTHNGPWFTYRRAARRAGRQPIVTLTTGIAQINTSFANDRACQVHWRWWQRHPNPRSLTKSASSVKLVTPVSPMIKARTSLATRSRVHRDGGGATSVAATIFDKSPTVRPGGVSRCCHGRITIDWSVFDPEPSRRVWRRNP